MLPKDAGLTNPIYTVLKRKSFLIQNLNSWKARNLLFCIYLRKERQIDQIWSSPLARAVETASYFRLNGEPEIRLDACARGRGGDDDPAGVQRGRAGALRKTHGRDLAVRAAR